MGNQTTYTYDGNDNQLSQTQTVTLVSGLTTSTTSWTYDANNHVTSIRGKYSEDTVGEIFLYIEKTVLTSDLY